MLYCLVSELAAIIDVKAIRIALGGQILFTKDVGIALSARELDQVLIAIIVKIGPGRSVIIALVALLG